MSIAKGIYNTLFRRNFVFVGTVFTAAFAFEMAFDSYTDKLWDNLNKGRQWKDIRHKYVEDEE
ncbi:ubiquinol-cytochrome C reductase [Ascobolus immersus RN42]|uniref:Complex III subunit 9 n=1 Tax=Ascobolus immersus RN42 TaxID=1160509 RepID=A0A3N4HJ27_ASCIM|nr:ubiquinol-cytochrome C reductase [Ascobolus immersus RN42]